MFVIIVDLTVVAAIVAIVLVFMFGKSKQADDQDEQKRRHTEELLRSEAKLQTSATIVCMTCGATFKGPLTDQGCPHCRTKDLCVPKEDYDNGLYGAKR